jgi:hypothetical protein
VPKRQATCRTVDILVVRVASTIGHRRSEAELQAALDELGVSWAAASTDYGLLERLPLSLNLLDLTHAASTRWAVTRALKSVAPRAFVYAAANATLLEPSARLARGAVRFDALAVENRRGVRHLVQRALERRRLPHARVLLPFGAPETWPPLARQTGRPIVALPTPVEGQPAAARREPTVVCYAGNPEKKRLEVLVGAWAAAGPPAGHELLVTGIDAPSGRRFLRERGVDEPAGITWCGALPESRYRRLTSRATAYLAASRFEDYGIAQLEALADGALLVTVASEGPFEALPLARRLDPALVAEEPSARGLAHSLRHALSLDEDQRRRYREQAAAMLAPYSRASFRSRLRDEVLPLLLGSETQPS